MRLTLEDLPKSLDETYERLLKGISEDSREYACRLLHCLTVAIRPLSVEELAEILAFDWDMGQGSIPKFHADRRRKDQEYAVLSTCSSLVSIVDNNGSRIVQFSHFSVKEFLMSNRLATSTGDVSLYHILPVPAHTILARVCLGYLLYLDNHVDDESMKGFPLAKYAAQHWVAHAKFKDVASRVKDGVISFFDPDKPHFSTWVQIHDMDSPVFRVSLMKRPNRPNPLYYAALCGFQDVVEHLAITHPTLVNAIGGRYESPLLVALRGKYLRIAELLLEHGGDVDVRGKRGHTPLHNVVLWSHSTVVDTVRFLLKHGTDVNARRSGDICTPLHLAANNGELGVTRLLLDHTADVNSRNNKGQTPLHLVSRLEMSLNESDRPGVVRLLIAHGADVNARDMTHATPLHYASHRGRLEVAQVLLDHGATASDQDDTQTPLHVLLESDNNPHDVLILVELLLKFGADANKQDENNVTPLHLALRKKWFDIARKLLEHGANPNAKNDQGQITLHLLLQPTYAELGHADLVELLKRGANVNAQDENSTTPLHLASSIGSYPTARELLDRGANPNAQDNQGRTPLQLLLENSNNLNGCLDLAGLLLSYGADMNIQDKNNVTALHWATNRWVLQVAQVLLEHGAQVNMKNDRDQTSLHLLLSVNMFRDGFAYTQLLLEHGADTNAQDMNNITPLHLALQRGLVEVTRLLLDHGANPNVMDIQGRTPLHLLLASWQAQDVDSRGLVELMLKCGADATAQDMNNTTPLQLALRGGKTEIARILRNHRTEVHTQESMGPRPPPSLPPSQGGNEPGETPQSTAPNSSRRRRNRFKLPSFGFRSGDKVRISRLRSNI
jgi:ankyrin repeat protein